MNISLEEGASKGFAQVESMKCDMSGVLLIDKPKGMTSHDVLQALRRILGIKKLGHTGTLDPLASGLLVFCVGTASKLARFLISKDKTYEAEIRLGLNTETFDGEGIEDTLEAHSIPDIPLTEIQDTLDLFRGSIQQRAPKYSAIKVKGRALYKSARKGEPCDPPVRSVVIHSIEIKNYQAPFLRLNIACGKGTYIRSLANDIGARLGSGAYLSALRRTSVGELRLDQAQTLEEVQRLTEENRFKAVLLAVEKVIDLPSLVVADDFAPRIRQGVAPDAKNIIETQGDFSSGQHVALTDRAGRMLAVGTSQITSAELSSWQGSGIFRYERVL